MTRDEIVAAILDAAAEVYGQGARQAEGIVTVAELAADKLVVVDRKSKMADLA